MEKKEKIRKIYEKNNVEVDDDYIENAMKDSKRVEAYMRLYKQEEMESMNYILGKPEDNKIFTKFELEAMSKIDLFNRKVVNACKLIWDNQNNPEQLDKFYNQLSNELTARKAGGQDVHN